MTRSSLTLVFALLIAGAADAQIPLPGSGATKAESADDAGTDAEAPAAVTPKTNLARSPALVFTRFFEHMNRYQDTKDVDALHRAGRMFDLSDVLKGDQDYVGDQAARDLLNFLDRARRQFRVGLIPEPTEDQIEYVHEVEYRANGEQKTAGIRLIRDSAGGWLLSSEARKAVAGWYNEVRDQHARWGRGGVQDATTWLRDHMPDSLAARWILLDHWQWISLFGLIVLGALISLLARWIITKLRVTILRRRGVEAETSGWKRSRPFGVMAMAAVWYFGLVYLALPETTFAALMLATRFVLMVGTTWAVCSLIDYGSEFFATLAAGTDTKVDDVLVPMVQRVFKIFVVVMGVVWIADNLDINVKALLAGIGIGGVALALAAKDTVENFFGAVSILADRPFEVGDWVVLDGVEGTVETVGFRSTRIRTFYNSVITVPNALLTRAKVDNFGARQFRRIKTTLDITYDTPPDRIEAFCEGIRELIRRHPYTRKDYYHVYFNGFGDSGLQVLLYLFLITPDWATELREKQRFYLDVLRLAKALDVEFAFPTRTLHMTQGEPSAPKGAPEEVGEARRNAQQIARQIIKEFTGDRKPPAVRMMSDARDDAAEGGEG